MSANIQQKMKKKNPQSGEHPTFRVYGNDIIHETELFIVTVCATSLKSLFVITLHTLL